MDSKLINGNSLEVLKDYDDNSVDLLCTDPPYGYGFMGKDWDQTLPPRKIFEECLRVLKPGSLAFVMSAPRSDVQYRMAQMLEEVGFNVSFTPIYWTYATGFPKAMNIGKAVDKRLGAEREVIETKKYTRKNDASFAYTDGNNRSEPFKAGEHEYDITEPSSDKAKELDGSYAGYQPKPAVEVVIVAMKPLEQKGYLDQALDNQKGVTWLDDCRIPFAGMRDKEQFDKDNVAAMMNFDGKYEKGEGKMYEGGWEKPNREGLSRGIQASRKTTKRKPREENTVFKTSGFKSEDNDTADASPMGRFAANLLVQDDVLNNGKTTKSTGGRSYQNTNDMYSGGWKHKDGGLSINPGKGDEGSFSRYYDLDAWWESRIQELPLDVQATYPFLIVPKASKSEKNKGCEGMEEKNGGNYVFRNPEDTGRNDTEGQSQMGGYTQKRTNFHPTVKPIQLFSYLVTLGSRKDDVVLDPFMGSGTTPIACVTLDRKYLGIEREEEYFKIAEARVEKAKNPANLVKHEFF